MPISEQKHITNNLYWFAIRVTYSRELMVKAWLDQNGIENYVPMHFAERTYRGKITKRWVPMIHNLIFIRTQHNRLREIKASTALPIRYIMDPALKTPITIPDIQMEHFMAVVAAQSEHVEIITPEEIDLTNGDHVRVIEGVFAGIEGVYIRHKGHSKVAVMLDGIATALTAYVPARHIIKISQSLIRKQ